MLKPQDILVALRLVLTPEGTEVPFLQLSSALGMSTSEVHASVGRLQRSGLLAPKSRRVNRNNLLEFLLHGVRYCFPPERSPVTRGIPTSHAAPPLDGSFAGGELPPVWPHPRGSVRGEGFTPIYRSAPDAALANRDLYEWLALVDAVRGGRARERALARQELARRLAPK